MTRAEAIDLLYSYVDSPSLRTHCLCVGASLKQYAKLFQEDEELWEVTGILHDMDYEKYPEIHPDHAVAYLKEKNESDAMIHAIISHKYTDKITSLLDKALFACDELSGFSYACVLVRPGKVLDGMEVSSVKKKLKDKRFAEAVSRDDMYKGAELLGITIEEHIQHVIDGLVSIRKEIGI